MTRDYATCELKGLSLGAVETYSGSSATNLTAPEEFDILPPVDNQLSDTKAFLLRAREKRCKWQIVAAVVQRKCVAFARRQWQAVRSVLRHCSVRGSADHKLSE